MPSAIAKRTSELTPNTTQNEQTINDVQSITDTALSPLDVSKIPLTDITLIDAAELDDATTGSIAKQIRTTCPYCGVGCGVLATIDNGVVAVQGDPDHPANYGKLCSKGSALAQTLGHERRLTQPYYQDKQVTMSLSSQRSSLNDNSEDNDKVIQPTNWDTVLDDIAKRLNDTISEHGRDSVMFYVSGQLLTEDYYVANKFIKGFIGNNNIDSNSRLCMSSAVAGHKRAFGADLVTGSYSDLEDCDLLVLIGSNMAWCHPILFGRFLQAKKDDPNKKLVVIDPRRTDSCEFADLHLPIAPNTDTHLYNGLLHYLQQNGHQDKSFTVHCEGLDKALDMAKPWSINAVAKATQVDALDIEAFYQLVARNEKTVSAFSMGVNQSSSGTDKVNAIINTHLLTGRVGKAGANPFSLTGQPNAMGGREVGALANLLAAHLQLDNSEHREAVAEFWQTPQPLIEDVGVKAADAADAILSGRIKAIWIMATNPVVSLPEADKFRRALSECDLVIVSECSKDSDTVRCADIVLPAQGWGEKSGTVTNSERRISRQRQLLPAVGQAKPDWWIMSQVAQRMGLSGFDYQHPSDIFNEHVALTGFKNGNPDPIVSEQHNGQSVDIDSKNISSKNIVSNDIYADNKANININVKTNKVFPRYLNLVDSLINSANETAPNVPLSINQYDNLVPLQWGAEQIDMTGTDFKHHAPKFVTVIAPTDAGSINSGGFNRKISNAINSDVSDNQHSLRLITGRLRDQWHTMTRTALAPVLNQQQVAPTITLNPSDAINLGILDSNQQVKDNIYVQLSSSIVTATNNSITDGVIARVEVNDDMRQGDAFMPIHWSDAFASVARVGTLVPTKVDPISAQPELKNSAVTASPVNIYSVAKILVHPSLRDAMINELRALMIDAQFCDDEDADEEYSDKGKQLNRHNKQLPNLLYSLSKQENSLLINLAIPSVKFSSTASHAKFWQDLFARLVITSDGNTTTNQSKTSTYNTSFVIQANRLRIVAQGTLAMDTQTDDQSLLFAVYVDTHQKALPSTHWLDSCFADMSAVPSVKWLLAGRPASGYIDPGALVCSCMGVRENTIIDAIVNHDSHDAVAVGKCTKAGTNCGSCVGQINELIAEYA